MMDDMMDDGQEMGDISNRWDSESCSENSDSFSAMDDSSLDANSCGVAENDIIKSGPVFISSKNGLGWYSWRRRWLVLIKRAMILFKRDPNKLGGGQVNIILGGILLKKSGSVKVREDKRLLTILFPDVQDRRPFTLKTETSEDLHEWRIALEHALKQAPITPCSPTILGSFSYWNSKPTTKSQSLTSSLSLALRKADGAPSFLEKAISFLEEFGIKVEGILRISADLGEVQRRIKEFEEGNTEFDAKEDAHVVGDCVKHILRDLPSSLVPIRCCNELVKAYETYQSEAKITDLRNAIFKKLPKSNRLLFQRILKLMHKICSTPENRMSPSAVAACMAPLLLRPILDGECNLTDDMDFIDDDCSQLLGVAIAAKTAQAIVALILEEYHNIFSGENLDRYSISVESEEDLGNEHSIDEYYKLSSDEDPRRSSSFHGSDLYDEMDFSSNSRRSSSYDFPSSESGATHLGKYLVQNDKGKKMHIKMFSHKSPSPNRKSNASVTELLSQLKPVFPLPEVDTCPKSSLDEPRNSFVNQTFTSLWERDSVEKTQEQLQSGNNLPLKPEGGPSQYMSPEMFSNQVPMTREEANENAISEDDLDEGGAEEPLQLSLLQHLCGSPSEVSDTNWHIENTTLECLLRDIDAHLTFQETLEELSIQPNIRPPVKPKAASVTPLNFSSSKIKKSPARTSVEHRPVTLVTPFCSIGFNKF